MKHESFQNQVHHEKKKSYNGHFICSNGLLYVIPHMWVWMSTNVCTWCLNFIQRYACQYHMGEHMFTWT